MSSPPVSGPPPRLELVGITKRFGSFVANDEVSLTLNRRSFHALLGENGAGKSTLAKCIMGYHLADSGDIAVGESVRHIVYSAPIAEIDRHLVAEKMAGH